MIKVRAHAKINISLQVLDRREDGYHGLKTVFQSVALHDTLEFQGTDDGFVIECELPGVPTDASNLVWRAASVLWEETGRAGAPSGVRVRIEKRIPLQGGLGGGSSDAAAALVGLNRLWGEPVRPLHLPRLASRVGADVPFFLCGGTALGLNRGDEIYPLADLCRASVLLVFPGFGVSTPVAYGWLDEDRASSPASPPTEWGRLPLDGGVSVPVCNDLQAPVAARHPEISRARESLVAAGAGTALMSGSGSTVFGLFASRGEAAEAAASMEREGWTVLLTETATREAARPSLSRGRTLV